MLKFSLCITTMDRYETFLKKNLEKYLKMDFIDEIGLKEHLSPTRANGLVSMIKQLKLYAIAYQTQLN